MDVKHIFAAIRQTFVPAEQESDEPDFTFMQLLAAGDEDVRISSVPGNIKAAGMLVVMSGFLIVSGLLMGSAVSDSVHAIFNSIFVP